MSNKDFPEKNPEKQEPTVDFSDLGPLFAALAEDSEIQKAEEPADAIPPSEDRIEEEEAQEETVSFEPDSQEEISFQPQGTVDFSDLGPLFHTEAQDVSVVAGESAQVLKRLSELPPEEEVPADQEEFFEEASSLESTEEPLDAAEEAQQEALLDEMLRDDSDSEDLPAAEEAPPEAIPQEERPSPEILEEIPSDEEDSTSQDPAPEENPEAESQASSEKPDEDPSPAQALSETEPEPEEAEKTTQEAPAFTRPTRKGRPKRKKGEGFFGIPNLLVTVVWIAVTVLIGVTLGRMAWLCASDVLAFGREDKPVTITIYEADTIEDITKKLHDGGLIKYPELFKLYASLAVDEGEIHPGIWDLNTRYDYHALVNMMSPTSSREIVELMIPEGYSCRQIFALMEENKICTSLDLGAYAASGELDDYWFLEGVERGDMYCLEGYLFPDTYQFYKNDSPKSVLTKMLNNFESRFDESMAAQIDTLNTHLADLMRKGGNGDAFIEEHRFDIHDVINVASLIEKETSSADEGYVIASVIYNRLFNWPGNVPYLNIDATIVYALGGKNNLTQEDLKVNSPYNTYTHTGLTPGPIANPGLSSIRAALDPAESNYYYYVLDPALGSHRFSTTYDEHKANIASIGD